MIGVGGTNATNLVCQSASAPYMGDAAAPLTIVAYYEGQPSHIVLSVKGRETRTLKRVESKQAIYADNDYALADNGTSVALTEIREARYLRCTPKADLGRS
jgi:hypothetical protein